MQALRQILEPVNRQITITLPKTFSQSKAVEVIVLNNPKKKLHNIAKFKGIWKNRNINTEKISKEMREEWVSKI